MRRGVTLIELLLSIAIIGIIGAVASPFVSSFIVRVQYNTTVDKTLSVIQKAQGYAMDGKGTGVWGVCTTGSVLRLFSGTCLLPVFAEDFTIPSIVSVAGLSETTFSLRGEPVPLAGLSAITISARTNQTTIRVNAGGGIQVQ